MTSNVKRAIGRAAAVALVATALASGISQQAMAWPDKPITIIVPFSAGGGTDATGRILASLLQKELKQPINVVNRPGGNGLVGHSAIASADPDGYTIGIATTESSSYKPMGLSEFRPTQAYTPVVVYNRDSAAVVVPEESAYKTLGDLITAIKSGETVRTSTGGAFGGSYQVAFGLLLLDQKANPLAPVYVSSQGSAPGLQEMIAGGVDTTLTTLPEASSLIESGKARALAVIGNTRSNTFPDVPTTAEAVNSEVTFGSWRGVMAPKGVPDDIIAKLTEALKAAVETTEFKDFMKNRGYETAWLTGDDLDVFLQQSEEAMALGLNEIGLSK